MKPLHRRVFLGLFAALAMHVQAAAGLQVEQAAPGIHVLMGKGGNIGVMVGEEGTFLIDDQFADATPAILEAVKELGGDHPRFLLNTHYHGDHTGGNANLGGAGTLILAHDNVRKWLAAGYELRAFQRSEPPAPAKALPVITYDGEMSLHLNGEEVRAVHLAGAPTDGDTVIWFLGSNVLHTGDIFFNGFFPFIDTAHGGSLAGMITAVDRILGWVDGKTRIIPGHGPLATRDDLLAYRGMLHTALDRLTALKARGLSVEEAVAAQPLADLDAQWGGRLFTAEAWIRLLYDTL